MNLTTWPIEASSKNQDIMKKPTLKEIFKSHKAGKLHSSVAQSGLP